MASVTLQHIKKVYPGDVTAVADFCLEIADREFVILVGPSGCGKSTTLRMIAGLEDITAGELYIGDKCVNEVSPKDRDIAMVFQNYALYPHMSVYDNIAFGLKMRKTPKGEIKARVGAVAQQLEITELLGRKPSALSGGQRQRVALGRAMVREPAVFLLDEPLSNLDAKLRATMRAEIMRLHQRMGVTFIYVTHDQTEAMTMADRIVVMKDGFIMQVDTPQNLYRYPGNLFVAGFIGSPGINLLPALAGRDERGPFVEVCGYKMALPGSCEAPLAPYWGGGMTIGVRPEDIVLCGADTPGAMAAQIDVVEMLGAECHLHLRLGDEEIVVRTPAMDYTAGSTAHFTLPVEAIHLFDKATEATVVCRPE